ncbi:hypothetical protein E8E14_005292 [Neopestalotiopsis sp. 37M]|nr:hypothetical protein E8E14_005292 [Neopestalotiopsis sp. 37M]
MPRVFLRTEPVPAAWSEGNKKGDKSSRGKGGKKDSSSSGGRKSRENSVEQEQIEEEIRRGRSRTGYN